MELPSKMTTGPSAAQKCPEITSVLFVLMNHGLPTSLKLKPWPPWLHIRCSVMTGLLNLRRKPALLFMCPQASKDTSLVHPQSSSSFPSQLDSSPFVVKNTFWGRRALKQKCSLGTPRTLELDLVLIRELGLRREKEKKNLGQRGHVSSLFLDSA